MLSAIYRLTTRTSLLLWLAILPAAAGVVRRQQPSVIPTGNWPSAIVTADLNGDGKPDLVYMDYGATATASTTHILLGNGDGTFTPGQTLATTGTAIAAADFDGDGHPDLAWVSAVPGLGKVYMAFGKGDGTFAPAVEMGTFAIIGTNVPDVRYLLGVHLHDTGFVDLLVEDVANSALYTLTGDSSGVLVRLVGTRLADGAGPIFPADLNGDGHTDLVINSLSTNTADVFLGSPDGILAPPTRYTGVNGIRSMLLHDLDGDGHPDLIAEDTTGHLDIFPGHPDGTFSTTPQGGTGSASPLSGAGGHLVAAILPDTLYTTTGAGLSVLTAQPDLSLNLSAIYNAGPGNSSFAIADFNGDGTPDIAVDSPEGIAIVFGNSDGSLQSSRAYAVAQPVSDVAIGKLLGRDFADLIFSTADGYIGVMQGFGEGTFAEFGALLATPATGPTSILTADFNGDGIPDFVITQTAPGSSRPLGPVVAYGNGDGTFASPTPVHLATGDAIGSSISAAISGDDASDLINADKNGIHLLEGHRSGGFNETDLPISAPPNQPTRSLIASGDLNGDGKTDLIASNGDGFAIYLNNGRGKLSEAGFLPEGLQTPSMQAVSISISDLDGDGKGDVLVVYDNVTADHAHPSPQTPNKVFIWYGRGDGSFEEPVVVVPARNYTMLHALDLTGSGHPDLIMSDAYLIAVARNLGARAFAPEVHLLAGAAIQGLSIGDVNGDGVPDLVIADSAPQGSPITNGGISVLLNTAVSQPVEGQLIAAPNATQVGQSFTMLATVPPLSGGPPVTGSILFSIDGKLVGASPVSNGQSSLLAPANIPAGSHLLQAQYSGDSRYGTTVLSTSHIVTSASTTVTLTITSSSVITYGQAVDGYAEVASVDGSALSGLIDFYDGATKICTVPVVPKQNCPAGSGTSFTAGTHVLKAVYSGDATHQGSTSNAVTIVILADSPRITLASSINPAETGQAVTFTVMATGNYARAAGMVTLLDGNSPVSTAILDSNGVATVSLSTLNRGIHPMIASLGQTADFLAATSAPLQEVVNGPVTPINSTIVISTSANPAQFGQNISLSARVSSAVAGMPSLSGHVTFFEAETPLGAVALDLTGAATLTTDTLGVGNHIITARYSGDANYAASESAAMTQVIDSVQQGTIGSFTIDVTQMTVPAGLIASVLVKISPSAGFAEAVELGCSDLPSESTCTFGLGKIPSGGGSTTLQLSTIAPHACGSTKPYGVASLPFAAPAVAALVLIFMPGKRRLKVGLLLLLAMAGMTALSGCGSCTDLGTLPGTYTITVFGKSTGPAQHLVSQKTQVTVTY